MTEQNGREDSLPQPRRGRRATRACWAATALTVTLGISACGGSSKAEDQAAGLDQDDKAELRFARCMREHGVDVPDPRGAGNEPTAIRLPKGANPQPLQSAERACRRFLREAARGKPPSEVQQPEFRDRIIKYARCMRQQGVDMPDPQPGDGGVIKVGPGPGRVNPESATFRRADQQCRRLLPRPPGGEEVEREAGAPGAGAPGTAGPAPRPSP